MGDIIKKIPFLQDKRGISAMQDAILFCVMVSISGAILLPALTHDAITHGQITREKREMANEALLVTLATTKDEFEYRVAGDLIENALGESPVDITGSQYGSAILDWLLGRKQYHKSFGNLLAENLACQLLFPVSSNDIRLNPLTGQFDERLKENISAQLSDVLGEKYRYNFSAEWHPIVGVPFGGRLSAGSPPPDTVYVASTHITMPYSPDTGIDVPGIGSVTLTRQWLTERLEESRPLGNATDILTGDLVGNWQQIEAALIQNLTELMNGFLFTGIYDDNGNIVFPGVVNVSLQLIFEKLMGIISGATAAAAEQISDAMGSGVSSLSGLFGREAGGDGGIVEYFFNQSIRAIYEGLGIPAPDELSVNGLITDVVEYFVGGIIEGTMETLSDMFRDYIENFVTFIVEQLQMGEMIRSIQNVREMIYDWIFERIRLSKAEVTLMIWKA